MPLNFRLFILLPLATLGSLTSCPQPSGGTVPDTRFITTWRTNPQSGLAASNSNQIRLPLHSSGNYDFTVAWGDGSTSRITSYNQAEITHAYAAAGDYVVTITGTCKGFGFWYDVAGNVGDHAKLLDVKNWGSMKLHNAGYQFSRCTNLAGFTASDNPDLSGIANMRGMFWEADAFNQDIGSWDVSSAADMSLMFCSADVFNGNIGSWNVRGVTNMRGMFWEADAFNQDISSWDVGRVTNMNRMFYSADTFNKNISGWNVNRVKSHEDMFDDSPMHNHPSKQPDFSQRRHVL